MRRKVKAKSVGGHVARSAQSLGVVWLTRDQAAACLGLSGKTAVMALEARGELKPEQREGVWFHNPVAVAKLAQQRREQAARPADPGELAAAAFRLFEAGAAFADAVMELGATPDKVRELRRQYDAGYSAPAPAPRAELDDDDAESAASAELAAWEKQLRRMQP